MEASGRNPSKPKHAIGHGTIHPSFVPGIDGLRYASPILRGGFMVVGNSGLISDYFYNKETAQ